MHFTNIDDIFKRDFYKLLSVSLSPNIIGNLMVGLMVNPPHPDTPSGKLYAAENAAIAQSLRRRARLMTDGFRPTNPSHK